MKEAKKKSRRRSTSCGLPKKLKKDFHRRILIDYYLADLKIMLSLQVLSIREDFMLFDRFFFRLSTKCEHEYENKVIFIADIISRV